MRTAAEESGPRTTSSPPQGEEEELQLFTAPAEPCSYSAVFGAPETSLVLFPSNASAMLEISPSVSCAWVLAFLTCRLRFPSVD